MDIGRVIWTDHAVERAFQRLTITETRPLQDQHILRKASKHPLERPFNVRCGKRVLVCLNRQQDTCGGNVCLVITTYLSEKKQQKKETKRRKKIAKRLSKVYGR